MSHLAEVVGFLYFWGFVIVGLVHKSLPAALLWPYWAWQQLQGCVMS